MKSGGSWASIARTCIGDTALAGGDTNSWDGELVISVTLLGETTGRGPVRRNGAKPGDWLLVTGPLGGSIKGKHLTFTPRVREALQLHAVAGLHAMIDISDGLSSDLNHLCDESGVGALIDAARIPIDKLVTEICGRRALDPLMLALHGGEDFELLFTVIP